MNGEGRDEEGDEREELNDYTIQLTSLKVSCRNYFQLASSTFISHPFLNLFCLLSMKLILSFRLLVAAATPHEIVITADLT